MLYIISPDKDGIQFDDYLDALSEYRHRLPSEVASFAGDVDRFKLSHPNSLHDAWLERICVSEARSNKVRGSHVSIQLKLLGQMHDRYIIIQYQRVLQYSFTGKEGDSNTFTTFHGDLFTHEVRVTEDDLVIHEVLFGGGTQLRIVCDTFTVTEQKIDIENNMLQ